MKKAFVLLLAILLVILVLNNENIETDMKAALETSEKKVENNKTVTVINEIPFETKIIEDNEVFKGDYKTVQTGNNGLIEKTFEYTVDEDYNIEIADKSSDIIIQPITEIIHKGTKDYLMLNGEKIGYTEIIDMEATAYDLSYESTGKNPGDPGYGITYTGTHAKSGTVSVDPDVIPLGSELYIESLDESIDYGFARAEDIGSAINGNRIDLFINDNQEALDFGIRNVRVYILEKNNN